MCLTAFDVDYFSFVVFAKFFEFFVRKFLWKFSINFFVFLSLETVLVGMCKFFFVLVLFRGVSVSQTLLFLSQKFCLLFTTFYFCIHITACCIKTTQLAARLSRDLQQRDLSDFRSRGTVRKL